MYQGKPSHLGIKFSVLLLSGVCLAVYVSQNGACLFRSLTGIPCPACGMSRAWLALLHGDLAGAFRYHPLFWTIPLLILLVIWDGRPFRKEVFNQILSIGLVAAVGLCWVVRLIMFLCGCLPI